MRWTRKPEPEPAIVDVTHDRAWDYEQTDVYKQRFAKYRRLPKPQRVLDEGASAAEGVGWYGHGE